MVRADVILWCTGFRSALDHLAPLQLRGPDGRLSAAGAKDRSQHDREHEED
jgi:hypothetical protein